MKKYIPYLPLGALTLFILLSGTTAIYGQNGFPNGFMFKNSDQPIERLSPKHQTYIQRMSQDPSVIAADVVEVNTEALLAEVATLNTEYGRPSTVSFYKKETHFNDMVSMFGTLEDESGVFFTIFDGQVYAKFYAVNGPAYSLIPLEGTAHLLVAFNNRIYEDVCETVDTKGRYKPGDFEEDDLQLLGADDNCNARVQIVYSDDANAILPDPIDVFSQGAIDESNLAFDLSDVDMHFELARTTLVNYTEDVDRNPANNGRVNDLTNFRNNTATWNEANTRRESYRADIQVLIVSNIPASNGYSGLFGLAYDINASADDAYCILRVDGITNGRFTFPHEIAHLQGAKHDDSSTNPDYARGKIRSSIAGSDRTILGGKNVVDCAQSVLDGCRVSHYSNPDINFPGSTVKTGASKRDNARRMDETADNVRNWRETPNNLTINSGATVGNNHISNHVVNQTITTNGTVKVESGGSSYLRAGQTITLNAGFEVKAGGILYAKTGAGLCDNDISSREGQVLAVEPSLNKPYFTCYPNPFHGSTMLELHLKREEYVDIAVYDLSGNQLATFARHQLFEAGKHLVKIQLKDAAAGMYFIRVSTPEYSISRKVILNQP